MINGGHLQLACTHQYCQSMHAQSCLTKVGNLQAVGIQYTTNQIPHSMSPLHRSFQVGICFSAAPPTNCLQLGIAALMLFTCKWMAAATRFGCRLALGDPNYRSETQLKAIRSFRDAAHRMSQQQNRQVTSCIFNHSICTSKSHTAACQQRHSAGKTADSQDTVPTCIQVTYNLELAQLYMWAQTEECIFLAVHVPTGD